MVARIIVGAVMMIAIVAVTVPVAVIVVLAVAVAALARRVRVRVTILRPGVSHTSDELENIQKQKPIQKLGIQMQCVRID